MRRGAGIVVCCKERLLDLVSFVGRRFEADGAEIKLACRPSVM